MHTEIERTLKLELNELEIRTIRMFIERESHRAETSDENQVLGDLYRSLCITY